MNNSYGMVLARSIDILACSWIWRDYDVTISSMTGLELRKAAPRRWARVLGAVLDWIQKGHCELAIAADLARVNAAKEILS
jgi:hypothetical protein